MDHGIPMEPLVDDFRGVNIQTVEPRFDMGSYNDRPIRGGRGPNPRRTSSGNPRKPVYYEGYIFTKIKAEHPAQVPTWASARRTTMPVSQAELREKANPKPSLLFREKSAMEQYQSLHEFKRRQIDRLIDDRTRADDADFQYHLASIKVEERNVRGSKPQTSLIVILKRQLRPGIPYHPDMAPTPLPAPSSEIIDLFGQEDSEKSSVNSFGSFPPQPHHPAPHPFDRHNSEPWGHRPHVMDDRFVPIHHAPPLGEEQGHGMHPEARMFAFPAGDFDNGHGGHGGKDKKQHDKMEHDGKGDKQDKNHKPGKHEKNEKNEKKEKKGKKDIRPEVHHSSSHKSDKKHYSHSDHLSSESDWDRLSDRTEDTIETLPTSISGASKIYKKEKRYSKEEKRKSHNHHGSRDRDAERPIYREHTRKVPEKQRDPSPAPPRQPSRSSHRYASDEEVFIQPEVSHRGGRAPQREPRPRQISYSRERPRRQGRALIYDEEPQFVSEYEEPRSPAYVRKVTRVPRPAPVDYEKERLKLELQRERRDKAVLGEELDRTHAELKRASRMPPLRERLPLRDRRPPPIIQMEPPYPRPRRVQDPYYDDYDDYDPRYY